MRGLFRSHPSARGFPYTWIAALTTRAPPPPTRTRPRWRLGERKILGVVEGQKDGYLLSIGFPLQAQQQPITSPEVSASRGHSFCRVPYIICQSCEETMVDQVNDKALIEAAAKRLAESQNGTAADWHQWVEHAEALIDEVRRFDQAKRTGLKPA